MEETTTSSTTTTTGEKQGAEELPGGGKTAQSSVIAVYRVKLAGAQRNVTVIWCKSLINHTLTVSVEKPSSDTTFTCKVELKPWPFWSKKGFKSFEVEGRRIDVFWDLRSAKFSSGPEPAGGYYVAMVCNEEVALLLGDCKKEAYKRTKSRPSLEDASMISKRENVFGKKCFSTRTRFNEKRKEHDIVVENSINSGPKDPEMWISIDGIVLIHVSNLQWKFRGNETVLVEQVPVQVFWDVHAWLFGSPGHALFIFKPAPPENGAGDGGQTDGIVSSSSLSSSPEFCFFLYAWMMD
ncbi:hypothetical protein J5N97_006550 [Dioscorea zingiberensis]|uniref:DUF868 family protein n=1 Tax=Dioscorea zingiberensis TaxID=325984 RepID=A0A9D5DBL0_9LILI|nr:hypothetical protein J5N97_006550 [Dioscorea zingiberensis]